MTPSLPNLGFQLPVSSVRTQGSTTQYWVSEPRVPRPNIALFGWRVVCGVLMLALVVGACAADPERQTAVGSVVEMDGDLLNVSGFTVLSDGDTLKFVPDTDVEFSMPLVHLQDHLRSGEKVRVTYREVDQVLIAIDVVDANPHG